MVCGYALFLGSGIGNAGKVVYSHFLVTTRWNPASPMAWSRARVSWYRVLKLGCSALNIRGSDSREAEVLFGRPFRRREHSLSSAHRVAAFSVVDVNAALLTFVLDAASSASLESHLG